MTVTTPSLTSNLLEAPGVRHGFFGRAGGISEGVFASLNTGVGSSDDSGAVAENRRRCAEALGVAPTHLLTNYQIHSNTVLIVDGPPKDGRQKADGLVTATPGLALGALAADCMPWLFHDREADIIGAAHAGWRGALAGVLENTIAAMVSLGANPENIRGCLGPCLHQANFEVGLDLVDAFQEKFSESARFFAPGINDEKRQFDLAQFGMWRLRESGVHQCDDINQCTLGQSDQYFSYRASRRRDEADYGRNLSAIALLEKK